MADVGGKRTDVQRTDVKPTDDGIEVTERDGLRAWPKDASLAVVGRSLPRVEGAEKVTGAARYASDMRLPGQLYATVLRSPHPHARVVRIDASRAEALPGVHVVLSSANAPSIPWYDDSFLFDSTVRFVGDEVAAVAADSLEIARDAAKLIEVEYEPLPFVADMRAALAPGAPTVHGDGPLSEEPETYERGDVDVGFRDADVVFEEEFTTQTALHNSLEPHGCTAHWEAGSVTIWESTQSVFRVRQDVAEKLELPHARVRVIKQHMGGGFGAKQIAWKHTVIAALLSKRSGRPVQLMLDRTAENLAAGNRNATRQHVRIGAKRDGSLTAIDVRIELETGAYRVGGEASDVAGVYRELYRCPNVRAEQRSVYTNMGPAVAFRAPGYVEGAFALESAMDELARRLDLDPLELRLRNYTEEDQPSGLPYSLPEALRRCVEAAGEAFGWSSYERPAPAGPKRRGIGFAAHNWMGGSGHPPGYAWVKLAADGGAEVVTGTQDIGTGTRTGLVQIAAEELGLPPERVFLRLGDTDFAPYAPVSSGSATQPTMGPAVRAAAADARRQLLEAAAALLETPAEALGITRGRIARRDGTGDSVTVAEVMGEIAPHMILGQGARGPNPEDVKVQTFGAQCAEVEVDVETGEVTLLRVVASHDCGRIVNPATVNSQVIGGVTQGIGFALHEARAVDRRFGHPLNANLEEYKVPTAADVPEIVHAAVDLPDPRANSTGAKGIGEPPIIPTAPAVANAIRDAVGVRFRDLPLSRERVIRALRDADEHGETPGDHA